MKENEQKEKTKKQFYSELKRIEGNLNQNLLKCLKNETFPTSNTGMYMKMYNFVHKHGQNDDNATLAYDYYQSIIENLSNEFKNKLINIVDKDIGDVFIDVTYRMDFLICFFKNTFSFLDRYYIKRKKIKTLEKLALDIYKEHLFKPFQEKLTNEVINLLKEDRDGKKDNRFKIKKILEVMKEMDLPRPKITQEKNTFFWNNEINEDYPTPIQDYWYDYFKQDTERLVVKKARIDIQNRSTPEYISLELKFINEEQEIQKELINEIYHERLNYIIYKEIIGKNMLELLEMDTGAKNMLVNNKYDELSNLYKLFKFYEPSLHELSKIFKEYIEGKGKILREDKEKFKDPKKFIPELIALKNEINSLVEKCFENNMILQNANYEGFKNFMKSEKYPRLLASYVDHCMRSFFKGKSEKEIDNTLNNIIDLYLNLQSKNLFQTMSEEFMSERLARDLSLSINYEKKFIEKLNKASGETAISKMKGMINDLEENKKESENYKNFVGERNTNEIQFNVKILSYSFWDFKSTHILNITLPNLFSSYKDDFEAYYQDKFPERGLTWLLDFSTLEIQYLYLMNKNLSKSTLPQILILLELEKNKILSIKKLSEIIGCSTEIIKNNIRGLIYNSNFNRHCQNDKGVLICINNNTQDFSDKDKFKINLNFTYDKIKFSTIPMEKKKTEEQINNEEKLTAEEKKKWEDSIIQSNLIRIMKSKIGQVVTHEWLISATRTQIEMFEAQPPQIKENIEKLIEKNCIKRDPNNRGSYQYIA